MASSKFHLYFNIFVFTIIAGIVSLFLMLLLIFGSDGVTEYTTLIITVELGLLANIVGALYRIYKHERKLAELSKNIMDNLLTVKTCPDYWTMREVDGRKHCDRQYVLPPAVDDDNVTGGMVFMQGTKDTVNLTEYDGRPMSTVCKNVNTLKTPWTDIRAACAGFNISMTG
jgi:hypothetical protein